MLVRKRRKQGRGLFQIKKKKKKTKETGHQMQLKMPGLCPESGVKDQLLWVQMTPPSRQKAKRNQRAS